MADCAQKIISGNPQPNSGRAIIALGGLKGATGSNVFDKNMLDPAFKLKDEDVSHIDVRLTNRFDKVRYYSGDTAN